jgi:hypothetical protein
MVWTAAANFQINRRWEVEPVGLNGWLEVFSRLDPRTMVESIRTWVEGIVQEESQRSLVADYLDPLLQDYVQEMASFSSENPPDPRLIRFFIFEEGE